MTAPVTIRAFQGNREAFAINFTRPHALKAHAQRMLPAVTLGYLVVHVVACLVLVANAGSLWSRRHGFPTPTAPAAVVQEVTALQQQAQQQLVELNAVITTQQQQFPVAGKLAALAKTLPPRTWITHIEGKRDDRAVTIQVLYIIDPEKPYALPAKGWIETLKADPVFGRQLKRLLLQRSSRESRGKADLFNFELAAEWSR